MLSILACAQAVYKNTTSACSTAGGKPVVPIFDSPMHTLCIAVADGSQISELLLSPAAVPGQLKQPSGHGLPKQPSSHRLRLGQAPPIL